MSILMSMLLLGLLMMPLQADVNATRPMPMPLGPLMMMLGRLRCHWADVDASWMHRGCSA
jgi:hypothetical protein